MEINLHILQLVYKHFITILIPTIDTKIVCIVHIRNTQICLICIFFSSDLMDQSAYLCLV